MVAYYILDVTRPTQLKVIHASLILPFYDGVPLFPIRLVLLSGCFHFKFGLVVFISLSLEFLVLFPLNASRRFCIQFSQSANGVLIRSVGLLRQAIATHHFNDRELHTLASGSV